MISLVVVAVAGYLIGSIPFGLLIARWVAGVDLRKVGSGNIGATNVTRVVGKKWGAVALALDAGKGAIPTSALPILAGVATGDLLHASVLGGVAAILGHMFSPWLGFRGGKGVATAMGVVIILAPIGFLAALATFVILLAVTRIVSVGSIGAALSFAITQWFVLQPNFWSESRWSLGAFSIGVPALIIFQHRSNIRRLLRGEEHAFRKKSAATTEDAPVITSAPQAATEEA